MPLAGRAPVFVTGGSGFVGGRLVRRLLGSGRPVRALCRERPVAGRGVETVAGDLRDVAGFARALRGCDTVFHCAALLDPVPDAASADEVNHRATRALAVAAVEAGVGCFVHSSSIAAIGTGRGEGLLQPDVPCAPTTHYGRSKRAAERALLALDMRGTRLVIARPPTVYGPGDRRNFLALTRAVDTGLFPIPGRGENRMSFCHVDNLTGALTWLAADPGASGIIHVDDGAPVTLRDAIDTIARALGRRPLPLPFPMPVARGAARTCELLWRVVGTPPPLSRGRLRTLTSDFALDAAALGALGFRPDVDFSAGVADTVAWYRREGLIRIGPRERR